MPIHGEMKKCIWFLLLFSWHLVAVAQNEAEPVATLLKSELLQAGVSFSAITFDKSTGSGLYLHLLKDGETDTYKLRPKPEDAFFIKATDKAVAITATTVAGLRNGVYWYLQHLGYRYYFPHKAWQVVPQLKSAYKPVEKLGVPAYLSRRIWYAFGTGTKQADADYNTWTAANLLGGQTVNAGHSYEAIVSRNKDVFLQHPEYFAQKVNKGQIPKNPKFEVGNDALVQLCITDAFAQIENTLKKTGQPLRMISMDPSDGGGFSNNPISTKIGGAGDQVFYLANKVAKAIREKYPMVQVGLYAYNYHAAPPKFVLEPNIVVLVATAMNRSAYRTDELINLWKERGGTVGIRDYYGVMAWDWDMPGQARGAKLSYVGQLKDYYKKGIRYFSAETDVGWISRGLAHYVATRLLWDVDATPEPILSEFFTTMFGRAAKEIEPLFQSWQTYAAEVPLEGDLYQWSKRIQAAAKMENDTNVQRRIGHIKQYLHYIYLFKKWRDKSTDDNLVALLNYAYRVQDAGIIASYPLFRRIANSAVAGKANMRFNDPNAIWKKNNAPVGQEETERNFLTDLNSFNPLDKTEMATLPITFKQRTETGSPAASNGLKTSLAARLRGNHIVLFQLQKGGPAALNLSTGLIKAKQFKTLRLAIYPYNNKLQASGETVVLSAVIQPKQPLKTIDLSSLPAGAYMAVIDDARNGFTMSFTGNVPFAIVASSQRKVWTFGRNNFAFAVGKDREYQIENDGVLTLVSPAGRVIDLQKQKGFFTIQVQKGEEGIWRIQRQNGIFHIQGVVPLVNPDAEFLLQPAD